LREEARLTDSDCQAVVELSEKPMQTSYSDFFASSETQVEISLQDEGN